MICPLAANLLIESLSVLSANRSYNELSNCRFNSVKLQSFRMLSIS